MSRARLILLGLLMVSAVSAVAVASSQAYVGPEWQVCKNVGTSKGKFKNHLCKETGSAAENIWNDQTLQQTETFEIEGTSGISKLKTTIKKEAVTIECTKDIIRVIIEDEGKSKGEELLFTGCSAVGLSACTVPNISAKFIDQLVGTQSAPEDEFKPTVAGGTFVTVELAGSLCALKGKYEVKGTQICKLPSILEQLPEHTIECTEAGSHLTFGGESATFTSTAKLQLVGRAAGWSWGVG